jgi:hypothetical protein
MDGRPTIKKDGVSDITAKIVAFGARGISGKIAKSPA